MEYEIDRSLSSPLILLSQNINAFDNTNFVFLTYQDVDSPAIYTEKALLCRMMQKKLLKWKKTRFGHVQLKVHVYIFSGSF